MISPSLSVFQHRLSSSYSHVPHYPMAMTVPAWKYSISDYCLQMLMSQNACSKSWFRTSAAAKSMAEITNEILAAGRHLCLTLTWMLHELLIYSVKTCYDCITIYLSISDSPSRLPWGFSHMQSQPLWHTLLSLFKYPVSSPLVQAHTDMSLRAVSLPGPGFLPVRVVTDWFSPLQE